MCTISWIVDINRVQDLAGELFTISIMKQVLIHMKPEAYDFLVKKNFAFDYDSEFNDEIDVIVNDVPYVVEDGIYEDPEVQLCNYYGIDYDQVNCIEAV